ncbi:hypothetical protein ANN_28067 [Periplaneta americana]|uniref:Tc1-like transposase DDE domain-containing protein n=1 Tax=Periplaneta americana TaxID=6978 RepID=A0ABQ8RUX0_PERAM|nr:hypothetical protein ANN_28067 [Periplaneta americana]
MNAVMITRLRFAENHADWNLNQWQSVLFLDESRYRLTRCDGCLRVWGRPGERFSVKAVQEIDRFGGGSIMVWARIMYNNRMDLIIVPQRLNGVRYIEDDLEEHLVPAAIGVGPGFLFVQDNARAHSAAVTRDFLRENEIEVMEWPAISPDFYPIEHLWVLLDTSQEPTSRSTNPAGTWRCSKGGMGEYPPSGNTESHREHATKVPSYHRMSWRPYTILDLYKGLFKFDK